MPDVVEHSQPVAHAILCGSAGNKSELVGSSSLSTPEYEKVVVVVESEDADEEAPLIGMGECRICQEEDSVNNLETPCACSGSLKVNAMSLFALFVLNLSVTIFLKCVSSCS